MDDGRLSWLAFHFLFQDRPDSGRRVLGRFPSVSDVFHAGREDLAGLRLAAKATEDLLSGRALDNAYKELEKIRRKAYTLLTFEDPAYPGYLKEIFDPPFVLYCAGRIEALTNPAVAVVGARNPTAYGRMVAERLAEELASRGCTIVSGLARGVDSCAHRGAMRAGRTVAVLGSGLDVCYPNENRRLFEQIGEKGAVLSEFPLGTRPLSFHFPVRNRIITGLSLGTVVVEAAERSGSLISARFALEQNREVFAVPGNITSALSRGSNGLLKGGAKLVEGWEDVAEELPPPWREHILASKRETADNARASFSREEKRILEELLPEDLTHIDDLADGTGYPVSHLLAVLLGLEVRGIVAQHPGKYFQRRM